MTTATPTPPQVERWLPVVGFEGLYEVSDQGRVRSLDRWVYGQRTRWFAGRILATALGDHYPIVDLHYAGVSRRTRVHDLVLSAFVGPRPDAKAVARHLDDDPMNNLLSNLTWGTQGENRRDAVRNGTDAKASRLLCPLKHPLEEPNLVPGRAQNRERVCRSCARARSYLFRHPDEDLGLVASAYLAKLTSGDLTPGPW